MADTDTKFDWQRKDHRPFELGDVFGRAFDAVRARFVPLAMISLFLVFIPNFVISAFPYVGMLGSTGSIPMESLIGMSITTTLLGVVALLFGAILAPAAMAYLLLKEFSGETVTAMASVRAGLSRFWVLVGAGILAGLGMMLGALLLIIPAIILYCGWFVLTPVVVMERHSVTESISRSWELTSGHKWMIFVIVIAAMVVSIVLTTVSTLPFSEPFSIDVETGEFVTASAGQMILAALGGAFAAAISTVINSALIASSYRELRVIKEGADSAQIADIFS